ncbi:uncharacterized protein si:ch211-240l19.7 [Myxocyprinus asiaticus]|uniref:uncharacterized protein si:ch211-240l19.7 n=1 Tax=Myxocyprinus asiaticus TaxID=70543 RepID=UPI002221430F|nr:uncharacterized protein si:ch211-240l19.7 [Myxocyprinus asiaticus]
MAIIYDLRLMSLALLMLASQLNSGSAAVVVYGLRANDLTGDPLGNKPDPYVKIWCGGAYQETNHFQGNSDPTWDQTYPFSSCTSEDNLQLEVWDKDVKYDDRLGSYSGTVGTGSKNSHFSVGKGKMYYSYDVN